MQPFGCRGDRHGSAIFVEAMGVNSIAELRESVGGTDFPTRLGRFHDDPVYAFLRLE